MESNRRIYIYIFIYSYCQSLDELHTDTCRTEHDNNRTKQCTYPSHKKKNMFKCKKIKTNNALGSIGYRKIQWTEFESLFCQTRFSSISHHISHRKCGSQLLKNRLTFLMHYIAYIRYIYIYIYLFFCIFFSINSQRRFRIALPPRSLACYFAKRNFRGIRRSP